MLDSIPPSAIREHHKIAPKALAPWKFSIILPSNDPFRRLLGQLRLTCHAHDVLPVCHCAIYSTLTWIKSRGIGPCVADRREM